MTIPAPAVPPLAISPLPLPAIEWDSLVLRSGSHSDFEGFTVNPPVCLWEAIGMSRNLNQTSDCPEDVSEILFLFTVSMNDMLPEARRQRLKDYRQSLLNTSGNPVADSKVMYLAADWLVRTYLPAMLWVAGFEVPSEALAGSNEITSLVTLEDTAGAIAEARTMVTQGLRRVETKQIASRRKAKGDEEKTDEVNRAHLSLGHAQAMMVSLTTPAIGASLYVGIVVDRIVPRVWAITASDATTTANHCTVLAADTAGVAAHEVLAPVVAALYDSLYDLLDKMLASYQPLP